MSVGAMLAAAAPASAAPSYTILFSSLLNDENAFSVSTPGGNSVTFDSPSGADTFDVASVAGLFQGFSVGLGDYESFSGDTLTLTFTKPIGGAVSFPFGIEDAFGTFGPDTLTITPNVGTAVTDTTSLDSLTLSEPEGRAFISAPGATVLTITTSGNPFAIGNITVPEPFSLSILGVGIAGLAAARRRRL
jgi:hypothetical protein